jgi:glycosyltransferase involved in cell wall biosynthesis
MNILFLESFFGGSHKAFAQAIQEHSTHKITLCTLPARHWKWRQGGSALAFSEIMSERGESFCDYDRIILTDLTDLNLLKSLHHLPPVLLYMHESQFHYPLAPGEQTDYHYGLKDFTNMLAADKVVFNSHYHGQTFFRECADFLGKMPDFKPLPLLDRLKTKWDVVYPGFSPPANLPARSNRNRAEPPVILWNHRWEHDKNPEDFYHFLQTLHRTGQAFRLIILGERFRRYPKAFDSLCEEFAPAIITADYSDSRESYWHYLSQADYLISTSNQENFGISVVEAIWAGAIPLLPNRLSYGEILPEKWHYLLYENRDDLARLLIHLETHPPRERIKLSQEMEIYSHKKIIPHLDQILENMP